MALWHKPRAGSWYVNKTGKLMKVKLMLLDKGCISTVLLEFLDGMRITVDADAWSSLDLDIIWHDDRKSAMR